VSFISGEKGLGHSGERQPIGLVSSHWIEIKKRHHFLVQSSGFKAPGDLVLNPEPETMKAK